MSSWMNDAAAVQNHNGAAFNQINDPNMGAAGMLDPNNFMNNSPNNFVDPSQFQNQQIQRMQNGAMRNPSPSFSSPVYNTNPIVPAKRPRGREDSMQTSPRQNPGMLPTSRSQTPQQNFTGFNGTRESSQHAPQPTPYSHLQHGGSANASPSPVMGNQLRAGGVPQRVSTASPHPFSPAVQQFAPSPSHSDHASRGDTPQSQFMQNPNMNSAYNQQFSGMQGRSAAPNQPGSMGMPQMQQVNQQQMQPPQMFGGGMQGLSGQQPQQLDQTKMMYQMQLQQQQQGRMMNAPRQGTPMQQPGNHMAKPQMPGANGPFPQAMRPQQPGGPRAPNPEQFMRHLSQFMSTQGLPLDTNPQVGDRNVNLIMIYMAVSKFGGYRRVSMGNMWGQIAQALQFSPMQYPNAAQQIKHHYERNLLKFEEAFATQQRQKMMQQNANAAMGGQPQMSPAKPMNMQSMGQPQQFGPSVAHQQSMSAQQSPHMGVPGQMQGTPMKSISGNGPSGMVNGFSTPQLPNQMQQNAAQAHARSISRGVEPTPAMNGDPFSAASPTPKSKPSSISMPPADVLQSGEVLEEEKTRKKSAYDPRALPITTWGGVNPEQLEGVCFDLMNLKPNVPSVPELGVIDIHALTMSLQSGIQSEVRLALDTLATVTVETRIQLDLRMCEDLVDSIIDLAEEELELLAENAAEVSDVMLVSSYEEVARACRIERVCLQDVPRYGTLDYELDRTVDRLICITTILRNMSFYETNHPVLADKAVVVLICSIIRHLGTRHMLARTHANTLDLMKDLIIFLSNLAQAVEIPSKEQALCLLHFLLAFAPCPPPIQPGSNKVVFSPYDPAIHRYLPPAVDSLAKLLARDEPNRSYYKIVFASEATASPPYDLLTKAFALAISPIPGNKQESHRAGMMQTVDARKPHLMQGMLAAEIISNLVPGFESGVARSWLTSEDGFAQNLLRLITVLSTEPSGAGGARVQPSVRQADDEALLHITLSGITVLRRLFEKSRDPDDPDSTVPTDGMIKQENLLGALMLKPPNTQPRPEVIKQLCLYAKLDM